MKQNNPQTSFFDEPNDWLEVYHFWVNADYDLIPVSQSFDYEVVKKVMSKSKGGPNETIIQQSY